MSEDIRKKELAIGRKAAKMAQNYLHDVLRQKLTIRGKGGKKSKPILQATKVTAKMGDHRLMGLNFTSSKVGFILHYGFTGVRSATTVYYNASRFKASTASRSRADVDLKPQELFDNIYLKSGALDYLMAELSNTRTEAFEVKLNNLVLKINNTKDSGSS